MTRQKLTISVAAAAFALTLTPAWALQDAKGNAGQAGSRPSGGAPSTGSAAPRGGGSSGGSSSGSSAGSSSSGSSSGSAGSSSGSSGSGSSYGSSRAPRAPERSPDRSPDRSSVDRRSGSSSDRAVPRGSASGNVDSRGTSASAGDDQSPSRNRVAVPAYSRPRDGRTPIGSAVERRHPLPGRGDGYYPSVIYDPYYSSYYGYRNGPRYSYWSPFGYGYGLGYFSYDPYLSGGYGYDPYGYGYGYEGYQGYQGYAGDRYRDVGSLRLKVKPTNAQILIDGYFVGVVDSFDGVFQRLGVESGAHRVELRADGYEPVQFEVMITPGETITYKGEMKRIR